ncbi:Na+/H+ antiporter NhaC family protein [Desulfobotulus sp. H1]|uniref:Na+/H+ antiporter NhaC family protein n=1 Tax=Desulfobotulus pelophilus TaxID=2823377 RepID=A0ABT3NB59_9BACT|nr:Na+/H+ antiporter NhaC family protein [Desulfobotulus pelophilus]MCW7754699.1 Na+/H+ antiporter NhaC family protein [Desulfobotulus pelophilus]
MELIAYDTSAWSLLPPAIAIILAVLTRRVLISLGLGIITGVLMLCGFSPGAVLSYLGSIVLSLFWEDGGVNTWNVFIVLFLILLGIMTRAIALSGGSRAFGEWAMERVASRRGARMLTAILGVFIFIDDYFNSLAVGSISRPVTDRYRISRAKLAYLLDSTAAPICVISPVSSWGAYIIALIGSVLAAHSFMASHSPLGTFMSMIPMNYYAIFSLMLVFFVAWTGRSFGPMRIHEERALGGQLYDPDRTPIAGNIEAVDDQGKGSVQDLVQPILVLILATTAAMIWTGASEMGDEPFTLLGAFENTDVAKSLVYGGLAGLAVTFGRMVLAGHGARTYASALVEGTRAMLPAIWILLFAWTIIIVIKAIQTGVYLAGMIDGTIPIALIPVLVFLISGAMAFATGTSWGTFGIMLPIAGDIAAKVAPDLLLPVLAAVLAGAVLGDHCSPISDTTILSSTGASCHHMDHVLTQLPYALFTAAIAGVAYLMLGFTGSVGLGLLVGVALLSLAGFYVVKNDVGRIEEN